MAKTVKNTNTPAAAAATPALIQTAIPTVNDPLNILNSKRYIKGRFEFKSPAEDLAPVIAILSPLNCEISLTGSHEASNGNADDTINKAWGRTLMTVKARIDDDISYEMGIMYALDLTVPAVKLFRGAKVNACLNQCIFGADDLTKINMSTGTELDLLKKYAEEFTGHMQRSAQRIQEMKSILLNAEQVKACIGDMLIKAIVGNRPAGVTALTNAVQLIHNKTSKYFKEQANFSVWHLYNAVTEYYDKNTNFWDIPEKTFDAYKLVSNN